jgi:hypothetical protein
MCRSSTGSLSVGGASFVVSDVVISLFFGTVLS